jgi:hypothetical protein
MMSSTYANSAPPRSSEQLPQYRPRFDSVGWNLSTSSPFQLDPPSPSRLLQAMQPPNPLLTARMEEFTGCICVQRTLGIFQDDSRDEPKQQYLGDNLARRTII